jgi:hypothetical protein
MENPNALEGPEKTADLSIAACDCRYLSSGTSTSSCARIAITIVVGQSKGSFTG